MHTRVTAVLLTLAVAGAGCVEEKHIRGSMHGALVPSMELRTELGRLRRATVTAFAKGIHFEGEAKATLQVNGSPVVPVTGELEGQFLRVGAEIARSPGPETRWTLALRMGLVNYGHQRFEYALGPVPGLEEARGWDASCFLFDPGVSLRAWLSDRLLLRAEWHATVLADVIDIEEAAFLVEVRLSPSASLTVGWREVRTFVWQGLEEDVKFEVTGPAAGIVVAF